MTAQMPEGQDRSAEPRSSRGHNKSCPPHGPHSVEAIEGGHYVARCLACGLMGPMREDGLEAKLAFDQGCI